MPLVSSKLLDRKWKSREQQIHKERLRSVKSSIRTLQTTPLIPTCMIRNFKKEEMNESKSFFSLNVLLLGRYTEIEKANRILLERMTNIMSTNQTRTINTSTPQEMPVILRKKSMNSDFRRKELMKITIEN